jgi:hypothetical protein
MLQLWFDIALRSLTRRGQKCSYLRDVTSRYMIGQSMMWGEARAMPNPGDNENSSDSGNERSPRLLLVAPAIPLAFLLAASAHANAAIGVNKGADLRPGALSHLVANAETGGGDHRAGTEASAKQRMSPRVILTQWYNWPNWPNWFNCFAGYWRKC